MERAAHPVSKASTGAALAKPPNLFITLVPVKWSITPANKNKAPLKSEWLNTWNTAANRARGVLIPIKATINPSWLTVE